MRLCWEHGVSICFFTDWGRLEARVEGVPQSSMMLRRAQHAAANPSRIAALARTFVAGKLDNVRWLLARSAREATHAADGDQLRTAAGCRGSQLAQVFARLMVSIRQPQSHAGTRGVL